MFNPIHCLKETGCEYKIMVQGNCACIKVCKFFEQKKSEKSITKFYVKKDVEEDEEPQKNGYSQEMIDKARNILKCRKRRGALNKNQILALDGISRTHYHNLTGAQVWQLFALIRETDSKDEDTDERKHRREYMREYRKCRR